MDSLTQIVLGGAVGEVVLGKNRYGKTGSKVLGVVGDRCKILNSAEDAMIEMKRLKKDKSNGS